MALILNVTANAANNGDFNITINITGSVAQCKLKLAQTRGIVILQKFAASAMYVCVYMLLWTHIKLSRSYVISCYTSYFIGSLIINLYLPVVAYVRQVTSVKNVHH